MKSIHKGVLALVVATVIGGMLRILFGVIRIIGYELPYLWLTGEVLLCVPCAIILFAFCYNLIKIIFESGIKGIATLDLVMCIFVLLACVLGGITLAIKLIEGYKIYWLSLTAQTLFALPTIRMLSFIYWYIISSIIDEHKEKKNK